jgi:hypothetical protein
MGLGMVSNEGDVIPPHIFAKGLKINTEEYLEVLNEVVKPWMDGAAASATTSSSRMRCLPTTARLLRIGAGRTFLSSGQRRCMEPL